MRTISVTCIITSASTQRNLPILKRCIESLRRATTPGIKLRLIVTTQNKDHVLHKVRGRIDDIVLSPMGSGFVGMNNNAVYKSISQKSDYHLIINDDARVNSDFFSSLRLASDKYTKPDIVVPLIYESKGPLIDSYGVEYFASGYSKNSDVPVRETTLASMSCLLIKSSFIKKMVRAYGYFLHPLLVWYLDDVDFSIRALAIGARIVKCKSLVAHHERTFTWGRKSYFVMYQSFRNLTWIILMTWPSRVIQQHIVHILLLQILIIGYSLVKYGPFMYPKILIDTCRNMNTLLRHRKKIQKTYKKDFEFQSIFSRHILRTKHGTI